MRMKESGVDHTYVKLSCPAFHSEMVLINSMWFWYRSIFSFSFLSWKSSRMPAALVNSRMKTWLGFGSIVEALGVGFRVAASAQQILSCGIAPTL